jgi:hypothetical protein
MTMNEIDPVAEPPPSADAQWEEEEEEERSFDDSLDNIDN